MGELVRRRPIPAAAIALACVLAALSVGYWLLNRKLGLDSSVYRAGALTLLHGDSLYGDLYGLPSWTKPLPFTYPPVAAVLFLPLAAIPVQVGWGLIAVLSALAIGVVLRVTLPSRWTIGWRGAAVVAGALALEPVWRSLALGQVNLVLMAMIVLDVLVLRKGAGVLIGIAAAIKLTPLIFVLHLLVTRRWADAARAVGAFAGVNLLIALVLPGDTVRFWTEALIDGNDATSAGFIANQSLNGLLQRLVGTDGFVWYAGLALVTMAVAGLLVHRLHQGGRDLPALLVTAFCGLLVSPVSWTHHWVWVVPLGAYLLLGRAPWHRPALGAMFALFIGWEFLVNPTGGKFGIDLFRDNVLIGNGYVFGGIVMMIVVGGLVLRRSPARAGLVATRGADRGA